MKGSDVPYDSFSRRGAARQHSFTPSGCLVPIHSPFSCLLLSSLAPHLCLPVCSSALSYSLAYRHMFKEVLRRVTLTFVDPLMTRLGYFLFSFVKCASCPPNTSVHNNLANKAPPTSLTVTNSKLPFPASGL